jgi:FAD/FMN-containing dehydrogenase
MTVAADVLSERLPGRVLRPGQPDYESSRPIWNARIDARPSAIVRCGTEADVALAVRVARELGAEIAIRGGGHSVAGHGTSDGGIVIHLAGLRRVEVDPRARVAKVGGGLSWADVDEETARHGLATVGGQISTTGVGGLTVGGGVGWLMRQYGLTVDNLRSAVLIDAEGERHHLSADEEPDLFWAVRGGGGNFGVVTEFEFALHPVSRILGGTLAFGLNQAREVMTTFADVADGASNELTMMVLIVSAPQQASIPDEHRGRPLVLFALCYAGDPARGDQVVAPFRALGPLVDSVRVMPYVDLQSLFDQGSRPGFGNTWRSPFLNTIEPELIDVIAEHSSQLPSPGSQVLLCNMGGAVADVPVDATSFSHRRAPFYLEVIAKWDTGEDVARPRAWASALSEAVEPWSTGYTYVNFLDSGHSRGTRAAYHPSTYERLRELKARYDPENTFRVNHNIEP